MSIELVPYDSAWPDAFAREASQLKEALGDILLDLEHIGSTSIPGLLAKPVIDILAIVGDAGALDIRSQTFEAIGYQVRGEFGIPGRRYFRKDDELGRRTHHIHAYSLGADEITRHLSNHGLRSSLDGSRHRSKLAHGDSERVVESTRIPRAT